MRIIDILSYNSEENLGPFNFNEVTLVVQGLTSNIYWYQYKSAELFITAKEMKEELVIYRPKPFSHMTIIIRNCHPPYPDSANERPGRIEY